MESIEESVKSNSKEGFVQHVFNMDEDSKHEILNIMQYALLAIIPVVILNKSIQRFVPEADEEKGTPEILAEVVFQVVTMFLGILLIHRIVSYVPTYSQAPYAKLHVTNIILAFLVIVLSLQTKLGEKVNILLERLSNVVYGETNLKKQKKDNSVVKVSQPLSGMASHQASRADERGSPSQQYPSSLGDMAQAQSLAQTGANSTPNFNAMYAGPNTPLVGAATPGEPMSDMMHEPAAANSVLGGGSFGSLF
jgi:hypothetical protein